MPIIVTIIVGVGFWWAGYTHDDDKTLQVPRWLSMLLWNANNKPANIWSMAVQITGYLLVLGAICAKIILPTVEMRQIALAAWFASLFLMVAIWLIIAPKIFK